MAIEQNQLTRLVEDIYATRDDDIQCEEAATQMALCADALPSDEAARRQYPALWRHFRFCPDCAREYRMLLDLAQLEAAGQLQPPAYIPRRPTRPEATFWGTIKEKVQTAFSGFAPPLAMATAGNGGVRRGVNMGFEPVTVSLADGMVEIQLELQRNDSHPERRDLFCAVAPIDPDVADRLEGAPIWLQQAADNAVLQEATLDGLGDVSFTHIAPGAYTLRLFLAEREYTVTDLILP